MDFQKELAQAAAHLSANDPILAPVIALHGLPSFEPHTDYYGALISSIIGQQLSVKAAATIKGRFRDLYNGALPSPEQVMNTPHEQLRACGFSNAKANYVRDLAEHVLSGALRFDKLDSQTNDEIIKDLTAVKGVGDWTAHMFLMFSMGRLDILAVGDLGVRNGVRQLYGFENIPTPLEVTEIAAKNNWHPYESAACWYLWRVLDNEPK